MKVVKAIYNFLVGDMIILTGVVLAVVLLVLISSLSALAALRVAIGPILLVVVLLSLFATLYREARGR